MSMKDLDLRRLYQTIQALDGIPGVLRGERQRRISHAQRRRGCEWSRDWSGVVTGQGMLGATGSWKRQEMDLWREYGPTDTLILDFWPLEL